MDKAGLLAWCLVGAACGRIGFDELGTSDGASGDGAPVLSCSELEATCGSAGTLSCCDSTLVPGGTFYRSYDVGADAMYPDMSFPATVSTFRLDTFEVTVGRFRQFVNAGMGTQASPPPTGAGARSLNGIASQGGWDPTWTTSLKANTAALVAAVDCNTPSWTPLPGANESLPITCITWFEAMAFCTWDGGFLPTETEWNYAAAGGDEQRVYPWSNPPSAPTIDCSYANHFDGTANCVSALNRVGSESPKGDGKWGHADLGGNLWEWTLDWYTTPYANPCTDCANIVVAEPDRGFRGGGYIFDASGLRGAFRGHSSPGTRNIDLGVRCARSAL